MASAAGFHGGAASQSRPGAVRCSLLPNTHGKVPSDRITGVSQPQVLAALAPLRLPWKKFSAASTRKARPLTVTAEPRSKQARAGRLVAGSSIAHSFPRREVPSAVSTSWRTFARAARVAAGIVGESGRRGAADQRSNAASAAAWIPTRPSRVPRIASAASASSRAKPTVSASRVHWRRRNIATSSGDWASKSPATSARASMSPP
jgi:hypothetical protein